MFLDDTKLLKIKNEIIKNNETILKQVWLDLFQLIGNPINILNQSNFFSKKFFR